MLFVVINQLSYLGAHIAGLLNLFLCRQPDLPMIVLAKLFKEKHIADATVNVPASDEQISKHIRQCLFSLPL